MLDIENTSIIAVDIQQKLVQMLPNGQSVASNATKLLKAASILGIDVLISEQYPKGLGETIEEIKSIKDFDRVEKTTFSALQTIEFADAFEKIEKENIVIFGIETHICLYQTALDLLDEGYEVYVAADCSSSRSEFNHNTALCALREEGAKIVSLEMILFELLKSSKHPNFKEIQGLIK